MVITGKDWGRGGRAAGVLTHQGHDLREGTMVRLNRGIDQGLIPVRLTQPGCGDQLSKA